MNQVPKKWPKVAKMAKKNGFSKLFGQNLKVCHEIFRPNHLPYRPGHRPTQICILFGGTYDPSTQKMANSGQNGKKK
jgi:hypothetical protein